MKVTYQYNFEGIIGTESRLQWAISVEAKEEMEGIKVRLDYVEKLTHREISQSESGLKDALNSASFYFNFFLNRKELKHLQVLIRGNRKQSSVILVFLRVTQQLTLQKGLINLQLQESDYFISIFIKL